MVRDSSIPAVCACSPVAARNRAAGKFPSLESAVLVQCSPSCASSSRPGALFGRRSGGDRGESCSASVRGRRRAGGGARAVVTAEVLPVLATAQRGSSARANSSGCRGDCSGGAPAAAVLLLRLLPARVLRGHDVCIAEGDDGRPGGAAGAVRGGATPAGDRPLQTGSRCRRGRVGVRRARRRPLGVLAVSLSPPPPPGSTGIVGGACRT